MYATSITISGKYKCEHLVLRGNLAKFSENEKMRPALVHTGHRRLAEASPHDKWWGIGLSVYNSESTDASTVKCATLATTSCKKIANILSR